MNHADMVRQLSGKFEISQVEVKRLLKLCTNEIQRILDDNKGISIPDLGTFFAEMRTARKSYNPYHKCMMLLPKKRVVKYHMAAHLKEQFKDKRIENE